MTLMKRNSFARSELHRDEVKEGSCRYCGNKNRRGNVYKYRTEHDGGRVDHHPGYFCSSSCFEAYNG